MVSEFKTGIEIYYNYKFNNNTDIPMLPMSDEAELNMAITKVTQLASDLAARPPFIRRLSFFTKREYNEAVKNLMDLMEFWSFPRVDVLLKRIDLASVKQGRA